MVVKKLLVLGSTGGTGREVVRQGVEAGYEITVLVRDPARLANSKDQVRVLVGDVLTDTDILSEAIAGQDAVVSTLGVGLSLKPRGLIAAAAPRIVRAMEDQGVRRLIFTSAFGVGPTRDRIPLLPSIAAATLLRAVYQDKAIGDAAIRASSLDWTILYPVGLTDAPRTGKYRVGEELSLRGFPTISRADVASALLAQLTDRAYVRKGAFVAP